MTRTDVSLQYATSGTYTTETVTLAGVEARYVRLVVDTPSDTTVGLKAEFYGCVTGQDTSVDGRLWMWKGRGEK